MIVIAVASPWTRRHIANFHKLPVGDISRRQPEIITNRWGDIQSGPMVKIRLRTLIAENVLKMVGAKRPAIFPLREADAVAFANGDPAVATDRLSRPAVGLLEPRDHQRRFRFELAMRDIVIRQREVEWILPRNERHGDIIPPRARVRVVVPP